MGLSHVAQRFHIWTVQNVTRHGTRPLYIERFPPCHGNFLWGDSWDETSARHGTSPGLAVLYGSSSTQIIMSKEVNFTDNQWLKLPKLVPFGAPRKSLEFSKKKDDINKRLSFLVLRKILPRRARRARRARRRHGGFWAGCLCATGGFGEPTPSPTPRPGSSGAGRKAPRRAEPHPGDSGVLERPPQGADRDMGSSGAPGRPCRNPSLRALQRACERVVHWVAGGTFVRP
jgi:hypothetical protein